MKYDFDHPPERWNTETTKWSAYQRDVLPLWVADMDFLSPQPVIDALVERTKHGIYGYPCDLNATPDEHIELRQLITDRLKRLYNWEVETQALVFIPGVVTAFHLACHAFVGVHEGVLVQTPVYPPILKAARETGKLHQEMQLTRRDDGGYEIDFDIFRNTIDSRTRMFILCNPHNPIGRVYTPTELGKIAELCLKNDLILCSDEIHAELIYSANQHTPIAGLDPEIASRSITLIAPSKTFNLAGLQFSVGIIPNAELRRKYLKARMGLVPWINLMGIIAARAAYESGQEWLDQLLEYLEANRNLLYATIRRELPEIGISLPESTYLGWLDCRNAGIGANPDEFFLRHARLALNAGGAFGHGGEGFVRLNFGCPRMRLIEALERMKDAMQKKLD